MEFDYYHVAEGEEFENYYKFVRQVALEDFELCEKAQANLEKGIYHEGILNPNQETGVACKLDTARIDPRQLTLSRVSARSFEACCCSARDGED
jgi:hypothetical protein